MLQRLYRYRDWLVGSIPYHRMHPHPACYRDFILRYRDWLVGSIKNNIRSTEEAVRGHNTPLGHHAYQGPYGHCQYDGQGEYCRQSTASKILLPNYTKLLVRCFYLHYFITSLKYSFLNTLKQQYFILPEGSKTLCDNRPLKILNFWKESH